MTDKWAEYKEKFCGCKDASRLNSCRGLPNCELPAGHPERRRKAMTDKILVSSELLEEALDTLLASVMEDELLIINLRAALDAPVQQQEPVAIASKGDHAFWVKWTDAGKDLRGPSIKLYPHPAPADALDAARYRYIAALPDIWSVIGDEYCLPSEHEGAKNFGSAIDAALAAHKG